MAFNKINFAIAALFAVVIAGCSLGGSTEETSYLGGSSEEPSVQASLENVTVVGRAMRLALNPEDIDNGDWNSTAPYGSILRMAELDSVTLDTTGVFYYTMCLDTQGTFSFDSVSLKSPYVMLELAPVAESAYWTWNGVWDFPDYDEDFGGFMATYSVLVDVRDTNDVDINVLTYLETSRIRNLIRQGKDFAVAKQQSNREIFDALGLYNKSFDYSKTDYKNVPYNVIILDFMNTFVSWWAESYSPLEIAKTFGETGSLSTVDSISLFLASMAYDWSLPDSYWWRYPDVQMNADSVLVFLHGLVARANNLGECSLEQEGRRVEISGTLDYYIDVACSSGVWTASKGRYKVTDVVDFTSGTMNDVRDGHVYKTVTYVIDGQPITWMAQNLTYSNDSIQPATSFDDEYVNRNQTPSESFDKYVESLDSSYWNTIALYDESVVIGADSSQLGIGNVQGICPNGWHIPTHDEWTLLFKFLAEKTGECDGHDCSEFEKYGIFGFKGSAENLPRLGFGDFTYESFAFIETEDGASLSGVRMDKWYAMCYEPGFYALRCVKN